MKKQLYLLALAAGTACQHSAPPVAKGAPAAAASAEPSARPAAPFNAAAGAPADTLPPATLALLRQHDLAPLWGGYEQQNYPRRPMEGFYGPPYYRISFYFGTVTRDPARPNLFHVTGLDRYKKVITPFSGTITVHALRPFTQGMFLDAAPVDSAALAYTAVARFALNEDPTTKGAGNYAGQALLDFYIDSQQHLQMAISHPMASEHNPTRGAGLIFRGSHVSNQTGQRKSVAFSTDYSMVVPDALAKLGLGDRSEEVNPNHARLGWNEAWENEEWWAKSPKPSLSL
jgi:hypothetical protein